MFHHTLAGGGLGNDLSQEHSMALAPGASTGGRGHRRPPKAGQWSPPQPQQTLLPWAVERPGIWLLELQEACLLEMACLSFQGTLRH